MPGPQTESSNRFIGSAEGSLGAWLNSRPCASSNLNVWVAPIPLISPSNRRSGQCDVPASKMENLIDDEPLLMTSMCTWYPTRVKHLSKTYTRYVASR